MQTYKLKITNKHTNIQKQTRSQTQTYTQKTSTYTKHIHKNTNILYKQAYKRKPQTQTNANIQKT